MNKLANSKVETISSGQKSEKFQNKLVSDFACKASWCDKLRRSGSVEHLKTQEGNRGD
jgi:hypothetical protein